MKKILFGLFVLGFMMVSSHVHAADEVAPMPPDLIVQDFSWYPLTPVATYTPDVTTSEGYIHGNVTIKNIGNSSITLPEGMGVYLYKSDESNIVGGFSLGKEITTLFPGGIKTYTFTSTAGPNITENPGTFDLKMVVDDPRVSTNSYGLVYESNEDNNTLTKQITIKEGEVSRPSITILSPNGGETYVKGEPIKILLSGGPYLAKVGIVSPDFDPNKIESDSNDVNWLPVSTERGVLQYLSWDGSSITDFNGNKNYWIPGVGKHKIVAINYENSCFKEGISKISDCVYDISDNYFTITSSTDSNHVNISGVSGPQTLDVGKEGTWKVTASSGNGGNLAYSVKWGDEVYPIYRSETSSTVTTQQSATFTHTYKSAGKYEPKFTVISEIAVGCITTPCYSNPEKEIVSINVKVVGTSSDTVIDDCQPGFKYSPKTGQLCSGEEVVIDCQPGYKYSPTTGQACTAWGKTCSSSSAYGCSGKLDTTTHPIKKTLKKGEKGDEVKIIQALLNLIQDGVFGSETQKKVMEWQAQNGLTPDGVFGHQSRTKAGFAD